MKTLCRLIRLEYMAKKACWIIFVCFLLIPGMSFGVEITTSESNLIFPEAKMKSCRKNADCVQVLIHCSCCKFDAINKTKKSEYAVLEKQCKEAPPPCSCSKPKASAKCVKKLCRLVEKN